MRVVHSVTDAYGAIYKALWDVGLSAPDIETEQVLLSLMESGYVVVKANEKKLTGSQVRMIRAKHKQGYSQAFLGDEYGVNPATISRIVRGIYH